MTLEILEHIRERHLRLGDRRRLYMKRARLGLFGSRIPIGKKDHDTQHDKCNPNQLTHGCRATTSKLIATATLSSATNPNGFPGRIPPLTREQAELFHAQAPDWQLAADAHGIGRELPVSQFRWALTLLPNICELTRV